MSKIDISSYWFIHIGNDTLLWYIIMEICTYFERVADKVPKFCHIYSNKLQKFKISNKNYQTNGIIDEIITLIFTLITPLSQI